ncbi:hypothetical protein BDD12DRAFT_982204 [Trichophaea hybrida]|nr:hypothetical protein BDD12DRAFT_982204 [Trichophaea hybrida]
MCHHFLSKPAHTVTTLQTVPTSCLPVLVFASILLKLKGDIDMSGHEDLMQRLVVSVLRDRIDNFGDDLRATIKRDDLPVLVDDNRIRVGNIRNIHAAWDGGKPSEPADIAKELHNRMTPKMSEMNDPSSEASDRSSPAAKIAELRSEYRESYCKDVLARAESIMEELRHNRQWERLFSKKVVLYDSMNEHAAVKEKIIQPLDDLFALLKPGTESDEYPVKLFFMFDEVSNLVVDKKATVYTALRRVLRLVSDKPVWTFLLSTNSPLSYIAPAAYDNSSLRVQESNLPTIAPFYSFALDLAANGMMQTNSALQLENPLHEFSNKQ